MPVLLVRRARRPGPGARWVSVLLTTLGSSAVHRPVARLSPHTTAPRTTVISNSGGPRQARRPRPLDPHRQRRGEPTRSGTRRPSGAFPPPDPRCACWRGRSGAMADGPNAPAVRGGGAVARRDARPAADPLGPAGAGKRRLGGGEDAGAA